MVWSVRGYNDQQVFRENAHTLIPYCVKEWWWAGEHKSVSQTLRLMGLVKEIHIISSRFLRADLGSMMPVHIQHYPGFWFTNHGPSTSEDHIVGVCPA